MGAYFFRYFHGQAIHVGRFQLGKNTVGNKNDGHHRPAVDGHPAQAAVLVAAVIGKGQRRILFVIDMQQCLQHGCLFQFGQLVRFIPRFPVAIGIEPAEL